MSKWECIVCGWVYDEALGDPDSGIAPGTRWQDIPDDWLCPDCGVGKEDFELIETTPQEQTAAHHETPDSRPAAVPVIIIGTGLAGYGVAKEFRKHDADTPLVLITADDGCSYSKPMLSTGYTKGMTAEDLAQHDAGSMARQLNASVWTMTQVTHIDTANQYIKVGDAQTTIHYAKLVLALGADTIQPPVSGNAQEFVYSINDLLDYSDFRRAMEKANARKVCIIGGGLIGCEFTNDLINGGFETVTVDPLAYCLPTLLPEAAGKAVQRALEEKGAKFHFGKLVTQVNKATCGLSVALDSGETLDADLIVCAVGVRPRIGLAQSAGLSVNRGIVTNRFLETSASNVYALGDCAEVDGLSLVYIAPLMAAAKALGKTLAGESTAVVYPAMPVTIKTPACPVVVSPPAQGAKGQWSITEHGNNVIARFVDSSDRLLGFALTGDGIKEKVTLQKQLPDLLG